MIDRSTRRAAEPLVYGAAGALLLRVVTPYQPGRYPPCPSYWLLGIACPFCGCLRAMHDLSGLDVASAFARNPLFTIALPVLVLVLVRRVLRAWRGLPHRPAPRWVAPAVVGVLVAFTIARNVPGWRFLGP